MFNWTSMVNCSENAFEGLYEELVNCGGVYILDDVKMPKTCCNKICTIKFKYHSSDHIALVCEEAPINYIGSDENIEQWLTSGVADFDSFESLKCFLKSFREDKVNTPERDTIAPSYTNPTNIPIRPAVRYDSDAITFPNTDIKFFDIDKDKLIFDLGNEILGQDENIQKIAHLVCNHLGTKNRTRPLSIFLYGPTGVGKTETVKKLVSAINSQIPDDKHFSFKPVDCTQYQEPHDISRLIGSAPGYVGFDEPGPFAGLEDNPNVVFVFDEIEKAAANITETLMQALDTGRQETNGKTLSNGETYYDLSKSIIFFTSNIELEPKKKLGFENTNGLPGIKNSDETANHNVARLIEEETREAKLLLAQTGKFKKEVLGRMKAIFKFNELNDEAIKAIVPKCISDIAAENHFLYVTEIATPILQEFINRIAPSVKEFGVRVIRNEAENYFNNAFIEYAKTCNDYELVAISGTLDNILIHKSQN